MKTKLSILSVVALVVLISFLTMTLAEAGWVRGYYRRDGIYVQPHYRTNPNGNPYNNYSFPGNYNPNTGRIAPGNPDTYLNRYYNRPYRSPYAPHKYFQRR